ncbi:MAG: DNA repair protein, partial [Gemmatimonadetes bacterium]|nr:DNA repair protein [Gemmatimonadota bacterium]
AQAQAQAAQAARSGAREANPVAEVLPRLESLREAVLEVAKVGREVQATPAPAVAPAAATDLTPYLKHLAQLLKALTERVATQALAPAQAAPAAAPDFGPYMEQLSRAIAALAERPVNVSAQVPAEALQRSALAGMSPAELSRQIELVEGVLLPLERAARRAVQGEGEGIKSLQVWQNVTEALELLRGMLRR